MKDNTVICKKCGSNKVDIQMVERTQIKRKKKTLLYWIAFGWLIEIMLWFFLTVPKLIFELFKPSRYKVKTKLEKIAVCQNCGYSWGLK